jgi:cephalosporin hydroxylase
MPYARVLSEERCVGCTRAYRLFSGPPVHSRAVPAPDELAMRDRAAVVDDFHRLWYDVGVRQHFGWTTWLGHRVLKYPGDLLVYQEILVETRPDLVIETGTFNGGSALFLATIMDAIDHGRVVTVDVEAKPGRPEHPRIEYLTASSTAPETVASMTERAEAASGVMVILDSDHTREHVVDELERYAPLVTPGGYLIVEDTNINGHPVVEDFGPGPMEAVEEFLPRHPEFERDATREKLLMTFNPGGFLRRATP